MMGSRVRAAVWLGVGVVLLVMLFWRRTVLVVPAWTVTVSTNEGAGIPGVPVLEAWQHNTVESESHTDIRLTDDAGVVAFPERTVNVSLVGYVTGAVSALVRSWHEAGFGPSGQVIVGIVGQTRGCDLLGYTPQQASVHGPLVSNCIVAGHYTIRRL